MTNLEYQVELSKFEENIANAKRQVAQNELAVVQLEYNKARFIMEYGVAALGAVKNGEAGSQLTSSTPASVTPMPAPSAG